MRLSCSFQRKRARDRRRSHRPHHLMLPTNNMHWSERPSALLLPGCWLELCRRCRDATLIKIACTVLWCFIFCDRSRTADGQIQNVCPGECPGVRLTGYFETFIMECTENRRIEKICRSQKPKMYRSVIKRAASPYRSDGN